MVEFAFGLKERCYVMPRPGGNFHGGGPGGPGQCCQLKKNLV